MSELVMALMLMSEFRRLLPYGSFLQVLANQSQTHLYKNLSMLKSAHMAN